jgi:uncharacterized membrane protein
MDKQYRLAALILLIPLITLTASTLTYFLGYKPEINTVGIPVEPKIETKNINLLNEDSAKFEFVPGKFYFVYFDDFKDEKISEQKYEIARSSKLTLRREGHRLLRMVVYKDKEMFRKATSLRSKYPGVIFLYDDGNLFNQKITNRLGDPYMSNSMLLVDSFALVIWEFPSELTFNDIFEEVKEIL